MKIKAILVAVFCTVFLSTSYAIIQIQVIGGNGSPLNVKILQGGDFTANASDSASFFVVFESFWDNTATNLATSNFSTDTITMTTATGPFGTGASNNGSVDAEDLILGFNGSGIVSSQTLTLGTGTRATSTSLTLNYNAINASGIAQVYGDLNTVISNSVTWNAVPEPSTWAAFAGIGVLGLALWRRRKAA